MIMLLFGISMSITGPQVNEPVKTGIEKIAKAPPGIVATCYENLSNNTAEMPCDFRLISNYETTGTISKPQALVMADYTTLVATDLSVLTNRSLFLPLNIDQVEESPPV